MGFVSGFAFLLTLPADFIYKDSVSGEVQSQF